METEETTGVKFELGPSSSEKKKNRRPKHVRRVDQDALDAYDEAGRCYERGDYETAVSEARQLVLDQKIGGMGQKIIVVAGIPFGQSGSTNSLRVVDL